MWSAEHGSWPTQGRNGSTRANEPRRQRDTHATRESRAAGVLTGATHDLDARLADAGLPEDGPGWTTGAESLRYGQSLTLEAWRLSGRPIPEYERHEVPLRIGVSRISERGLSRSAPGLRRVGRRVSRRRRARLEVGCRRFQRATRETPTQPVPFSPAPRRGTRGPYKQEVGLEQSSGSAVRS